MLWRGESSEHNCHFEMHPNCRHDLLPPSLLFSENGGSIYLRKADNHVMGDKVSTKNPQNVNVQFCEKLDLHIPVILT
jgi:hypothetical protein